MRVLVYKRTHVGDPDATGRFGVRDCMGRVRAWGYGAAIGVGGVGSEPEQHGIARKVTWVGIGPQREDVGKRGPLVTFERFVLFDADGPSLIEFAPRLAERIFGRHVRATLVDDSDPEVARVLALANNAPPLPPRGGPASPARATGPSGRGRCSPARRRVGSCT